MPPGVTGCEQLCAGVAAACRATDNQSLFIRSRAARLTPRHER